MSSPAALVAVQNVSKRFGAVQALDRVSLDLFAGQRVAFVGANGSGKTTLMRALLGLLEMQGSVHIGGVDVRSRPDLALAPVAYIPQVAPPLDAPVFELVRALTSLYGGDPAKVATLSAALGVELARIGPTRMRDLSGGTKQKVLAAIALAAESQILVCDEPTANLDEAAREAFFSLVSQRPADSLLILCSHRSEEVRQLVDRVVELREGKLVRDDHVAQALQDRALCQITVTLQGPPDVEAAAWLAAQHFVRVAGLRWRRLCPQVSKLDAVAEVMALRATLRDLQVVDAAGWDAGGTSATQAVHSGQEGT